MIGSPRSNVSIISPIRRAERLLCQSPREDLPPAAQWLRDNARALYGQAAQTQQEARYLGRRAFRRPSGLPVRAERTRPGQGGKAYRRGRLLWYRSRGKSLTPRGVRLRFRARFHAPQKEKHFSAPRARLRARNPLPYTYV